MYKVGMKVLITSSGLTSIPSEIIAIVPGEKVEHFPEVFKPTPKRRYNRNKFKTHRR